MPAPGPLAEIIFVRMVWRAADFLNVGNR